jgi:type 1 glutamine amidotransferase
MLSKVSTTDRREAKKKSPMKAHHYLACLLACSVIRCFTGDAPNIVFISGEFEYHSRETFPKFAGELQRDYNVKTTVLNRPEDEKVQNIPGLEKLADADLVILMIRRMVLPEEQLGQIKRYLDSGKPLIGLRTASHSFENWKEFDHEVLGGNYGNHFENDRKTTITIIPEAHENPILRGVTSFISDGSLYRNTPLQPGSKALLMGAAMGHPPQPVAWTHEYKGGRIFYSSLGHPNDFNEASFQTLLHNAIEWALDKPLSKKAEK